MVDRPETVWKRKKGLYYRAEFGEVEVSQNDTVTLGGFESTATGIITAYLLKQSNGTVMASSVNGTTKNQIDVSGAGQNVLCVYMAYGVKA